MRNLSPDFKYTDPNGLQTNLKKELANVQRKECKSYWPRFLIRRIPLCTAPFLIFFSFFLCLSLTKKVGIEEVNTIINTLKFPFCNNLSWGVAIAILVLLIQWLVFNYTFCSCKSGNAVKISRQTYKYLGNTILCMGFILLFLFILGASYKLYYGFLTFLVLTLCPLLIDKTLGLTRQNERFKLYIRRLERFDTLNVFREKMGIKLEELHFIEFLKLIDEVDHSKSQDTISDTSFITTLIENKLKT